MPGPAQLLVASIGRSLGSQGTLIQMAQVMGVQLPGSGGDARAEATEHQVYAIACAAVEHLVLQAMDHDLLTALTVQYICNTLAT